MAFHNAIKLQHLSIIGGSINVEQVLYSYFDETLV